jgi:hypothetical protein
VDVTIPYTFYPLALPHWIAWMLFLLAVVVGAVSGLARARTVGWMRGLGVAAMVGAGALIATMMASMVITFFIHDV